MLPHPQQFAEREDWIELQSRDFEEAFDADSPAEGLCFFFSAAVEPSNGRRERPARIINEHTAFTNAGYGNACHGIAIERAARLGSYGGMWVMTV